jgi:hypothetical protein
MQTGLERLPLGSNAEATEDRNEYGGQAWKPDSEIFHAVSTCCTESTHAGLTINGNKSVHISLDRNPASWSMGAGGNSLFWEILPTGVAYGLKREKYEIKTI